MSRWKWYQRPGRPVDHVAGEPSVKGQSGDALRARRDQPLPLGRAREGRNQRWAVVPPQRRPEPAFGAEAPQRDLPPSKPLMRRPDGGTHAR